MTPPRMPPLTHEELTAEQAELLGPYADLNFGRVMVRHPALYRAFIPFGEQLMARSGLPPRDRQILILRTAALCGEDYEATHHAIISRNLGLTDAEIEAVRTGGAGLAEADRILTQAADELVREHRLRDATWERLAGRYSPERLIEIVVLVGDYTMLSMVTRSLDIRFEGAPADS